MPNPEAKIQQKIRLVLGREEDFTLWRNETGQAKHGTHFVRYGLCKGSSDLIGILSPSGRFVALEVKTATGRTTTEQDLFMDLVRRRGGFAAVVRSEEEAKQALDRARAGSCE